MATTKKTTTTKSAVKKAPVENKPVAKKATQPAKKVAAKPAAKKAPAKKAAPKAGHVGTADLFIVNGTKKLDSAHQFNKQVSPLYGVEEYVWVGTLKAGKVELVRPNGSKVPTANIYNSGITLVGKANSLFQVENALTVTQENVPDNVINYCQPKSVLKYVGKSEKHTVYVRVYDNANGEVNDRWVALSIE